MAQRKDGRAEETITSRIQALKQVARTTNINDPEQVKEFLADSKWCSRTKTKFIDTYTVYLKFKGTTWNKPKYMQTAKLPFIPTEQEIDTLISGCAKLTATVLQTLKETGIRIGELVLLEWINLDTERRTLNITPEKNSNPRILPVSNKLIGMINNLPKNRPTIFQPRKNMLREYFSTQRKALALKLNSPRLMKITFHTLRHWKGTMEYHRTHDIMHVKQLLGHKDIESTLVYINIESALFLSGSDEWTSKVALNATEACQLIDVGFEYVTGEYTDGGKLFRKRK